MNELNEKSKNEIEDEAIQLQILKQHLEKEEEKEEEKKEEKEVEKEVEKEEKEENIILKFINKIKSTDYFFLTSPIHFKIDVKHQDIPFILIIRFNGYIWKVQKITIPYKNLIDPKKISLIN